MESRQLWSVSTETSAMHDVRGKRWQSLKEEEAKCPCCRQIGGAVLRMRRDITAVTAMTTTNK